ncbi:hypothetical protein KY284_010970 [Solanum tuberosum]|nr:hypothetical protein KY284_010970 [Solanum tuberosum]
MGVRKGRMGACEPPPLHVHTPLAVARMTHESGKALNTLNHWIGVSTGHTKSKVLQKNLQMSVIYHAYGGICRA